MKVLITGGSGLIGTTLTKLLLNSGHKVCHLSRRDYQSEVPVFKWDINKRTIDKRALDVDAIIHLAGANVGDKRWSESRKHEILSSRTDSSGLLYEKIKNLEAKPKVFISASGISIYPNTSEIMTESSSSSNSFLAEVTKQWETSVDKFTELGLRTVKLRTGIVLSPEGGALKKMMTPMSMFAGASLGDGKQGMPWIHLEDMCRMYSYVLEHDLEGVFNAVADEKVDNNTFTKVLALVMKKPLLLPNVPAFVLKMMMGEMAGLALEGMQVSNDKIKSTGFEFRFKELKTALKHLL